MIFQCPLCNMKSDVLKAFLFFNNGMSDFVLLLKNVTYL